MSDCLAMCPLSKAKAKAEVLNNTRTVYIHTSFNDNDKEVLKAYAQCSRKQKDDEDFCTRHLKSEKTVSYEDLKDDLSKVKSVDNVFFTGGKKKKYRNNDDDDDDDKPSSLSLKKTKALIAKIDAISKRLTKVEKRLERTLGADSESDSTSKKKKSKKKASESDSDSSSKKKSKKSIKKKKASESDSDSDSDSSSKKKSKESIKKKKASESDSDSDSDSSSKKKSKESIKKKKTSESNSDSDSDSSSNKKEKNEKSVKKVSDSDDDDVDEKIAIHTTRAQGLRELYLNKSTLRVYEEEDNDEDDFMGTLKKVEFLKAPILKKAKLNSEIPIDGKYFIIGKPWTDEESNDDYVRCQLTDIVYELDEDETDEVYRKVGRVKKDSNGNETLSLAK